MSVHGVADKTVETIESGKYPFIVLNLANPDMVFSLGIGLTIGWTHGCLWCGSRSCRTLWPSDWHNLRSLQETRLHPHGHLRSRKRGEDALWRREVTSHSSHCITLYNHSADTDRLPMSPLSWRRLETASMHSRLVEGTIQVRLQMSPRQYWMLWGSSSLMIWLDRAWSSISLSVNIYLYFI